MTKQRAIELLDKAIDMLIEEEIMWVEIKDILGLTDEEESLILG